MTQESYQRHIALRLANDAEVRAFVTRSVARQGDERPGDDRRRRPDVVRLAFRGPLPRSRPRVGRPVRGGVGQARSSM